MPLPNDRGEMKRHNRGSSSTVLLYLLAVVLLCANAGTYYVMNRKLIDTAKAQHATATVARAHQEAAAAAEERATELRSQNRVILQQYQEALTRNQTLAQEAKATTEETASVELGSPVVIQDVERTLDFGIVNGHDHLYRLGDLDKYLAAAAKEGIAKTLFVASSEFTFMGTGGAPDKLNAWSSQEVLRAHQAHPDKIIPFCTLHPDDPNKVELLQSYKQQGVRGLKLYNGHGNFYDRPLDAPEMMPVYAWCEAEQFPLLWHVNFLRYTEDFNRVMAAFPKLKVIIPHFGVGFFRPAGKTMRHMEELMEQYPGFYVDSSFGTREILVHGLEIVDNDPQYFREFYERNQDRIIFGTDMVVTGNKEKTEEWVRTVIRACRDMHEKEEYVFWMASAGVKYHRDPENVYGKLRGLNLPDAILKKVYRTNLETFLGGF